MVTKVSDDESELRTGDVIEEVNQQPVTSVAEYKRVASSLDPNETQCSRLPASHPLVRRLASQVGRTWSGWPPGTSFEEARTGQRGFRFTSEVNNRRGAEV